MSAKMNGLRSEPENRPSSETMVDLHVYLVPQNVRRDKFNNALNSNIDDTVSIGLIRVHPEMNLFALRDEIEHQLCSDRGIPKQYVFLKSVGRSLTRLKSKQEVTLKAKNFLPPQAYAPELYLLECTSEVHQPLANSKDSTHTYTQTSYDHYEVPTGNRQNSPQHQQADFSQQDQETRPSEKFQEKLNKEYLPLVRATALHTDNEKTNSGASAQHGYHGSPHKHDDGLHGRQHKHDEDLGIAGFTRETYRKNEALDRRKTKPDAAVNERLKPSEADDENSDQLNKMQDDQDHLKWNIKPRDLTRIAAPPPPLRLAFTDSDTALVCAQRKKQKDELLRELEEARAERRASERQRQELVKHAKQAQTRTQNKANQGRDFWKKRYFDEKNKTGPLEEQSNGLRNELDIMHKRLLTILAGLQQKTVKLNELKLNLKASSPTRPVGSPTRPVSSPTRPVSSPTRPVGSPTRPVGSPTRPLVGSNFQSRTHSVSPTNGGIGQTCEIYRDRLAHDVTSLVPTKEASSPKRDRSESPYQTNRSNFTARISPHLKNFSRIDHSPSENVPCKVPIMSSRELSLFKKDYMKKRHNNKQYPVELIGNNHQKRTRFLDQEEFDSDYNSNQSSAKSNLRANNSGKSEAITRKNVHFNHKVNYFTTAEHFVSH